MTEKELLKNIVAFNSVSGNKFFEYYAIESLYSDFKEELVDFIYPFYDKDNIRLKKILPALINNLIGAGYITFPKELPEMPRPRCPVRVNMKDVVTVTERGHEYAQSLDVTPPAPAEQDIKIAEINSRTKIICSALGFLGGVIAVLATLLPIFLT